MCILTLVYMHGNTQIYYETLIQVIMKDNEPHDLWPKRDGEI